MITTICILILIFSILKRPVDSLLNKLKGVDWKNLTGDVWDKIVIYSKKGGRSATRPILTFYYVLQEGNLTTLEVALVYAGIIYIAVPSDLLPRAVLGWVGLLDDVGIAAWIYKKIEKKITPEIMFMVENRLSIWFGPESVTGIAADYGQK